MPRGKERRLVSEPAEAQDTPDDEPPVDETPDDETSAAQDLTSPADEVSSSADEEVTVKPRRRRNFLRRGKKDPQVDAGEETATEKKRR